MVILFSTKCFLFVYFCIDLLKLKAYKLFENSDADLSWLLFLKKPTCKICQAVGIQLYHKVAYKRMKFDLNCEILSSICVKLKAFVTHHSKKGLVGIAKSINPGQTAQSAQSDHGRNFSLLADFLCIK